MPVATKPRPPQPGGFLTVLRDAIILLAGGGLTWAESEKRNGRY